MASTDTHMQPASAHIHKHAHTLPTNRGLITQSDTSGLQPGSLPATRSEPTLWYRQCSGGRAARHCAACCQPASNAIAARGPTQPPILASAPINPGASLNGAHNGTAAGPCARLRLARRQAPAQQGRATWATQHTGIMLKPRGCTRAAIACQPLSKRRQQAVFECHATLKHQAALGARGGQRDVDARLCLCVCGPER